MAKILLVDDDPLLIRMYQKKFENDGYTIATAGDGVDALKKVSEFQPNLILLDVMMPKMNGLEVLTKLKENNQTSAIPVIMLTNVSSSQEDTDRGLELGAVAYIVKAGNRPKAVVEKVKEVLAGYVREIPQVKSVIQSDEEKKKALAELDQANKQIEQAKKIADEAKRKLENSN